MIETSFGQFLRDYDNGVYDFTKDGKCSRCGECCTALLPVTKEEIKAMRKYVKRKRIKPIVHTSEKPSIDFTCPFRDDEMRICLVYDVRPTICRSFICNKEQRDIQAEKDRRTFDNRFQIVNMRGIFFYDIRGFLEREL